ncbi:MAG: hypothetical protein A2W61_05580 [Deltaproteobacteria bacterium RIFCSPLOWO2_01_44_7]|nr:MAG: hypothetical protein A2712_00995 [Deltaproteobacteria bacterium RIFCSPHIGHO2_01_FULL_43_49]OGQ15285.1 MAG: hypothetical protein A3D22_04480 [Deltaproteobacteria bacterium RIFCSPHIGHO2_02_FULL_44_53]OGQ27091.1 MAG: hypothetical protein A3D98_01585 [Deltaproteobacteria bacterium RIFCSPHIGHO2_12_FULL_44_21]OGQ31801.1 MAG: hypothetical protein A2979_05640 [Deltaproteobacteria bacterium RIFCSPLOWO2_01_FULL_45_74]OGQ40751.1 MAG: hypothetical protein A2W61_05580 [Deltaproteobacteria bacterium 
MTMDRRKFLELAIYGLGSVVGISLLAPIATYFLSPAWKKHIEDWVLLGETKKIPVGKPTKIEFIQRRKDGWMTVEEKRTAWVLTRDGKEFTVFDPRCTHLGCPYRWDEAKEKFLCPCHAAVFDVDGQVISGPPPRPLDRYDVKVEAGKLWMLPTLKEKV